MWLRFTPLIFFAVTGPGFAQVIPVGSIDGAVFDSSQAIVPGASITLVNVATGQSRTVESDSQGRYFLVQLQPARYRLEVEKAGFQKVSQMVVVETGKKLAIDVTLTVGQAAEAVLVRSEAPLVEASSATMGTVIGNRQVLDLPLAGRNPLRLAYLTPGITTTSPPGASGVTDISATSYISTAGSNIRQNEFYIDGVPNTIQDRVLYIPTADAVQEFNIQTNPLDAEFGHGGGFYANLTTKSGTNQLHGTLFHFLQNDKLNANNFFLNRNGANKAPFRLNQYGGTIGGPLIKDKTFWFFMHEGVRQRNGLSSITTVPTADQRAGNFSTTFPSAGQSVNIYDPFSTRTNDAGQLVRTQFPGALIPASRMDPVARNLMQLWPDANLPGVAQSGSNNYLFVGSAPLTTNAYVSRVDHSMGRHKIFGRFSIAKTLSLTPQVVNIGSVGGPGSTTGNNRVQTSVGLGDTILLSPTSVLNVQAGFARWTQEGLTPLYNLGQIGMPAAYTGSVQESIFPTISMSGYQGAGNEGNWFEHTNTFSFQATLSQVKGAHSLKYGFQYQPKRNNYQLAQRPSGTFAFSQAFTAGPDPSLRGAAIGQSFASFLLGTPDSGSANIRAAYSFQGDYYGAFIQDDWKVTQKLTLNLGLRYELQPNVTERYNRSVRGFDMTTPNPIEAAARANYAANPSPYLPVDQFRVLGGQIFATPEARGNGGLVEKKMFVPRIGLAYRANDRTVIRAGYGLFRSFWWQVSSATEGTGAETTTTMVTSRDGVTPADVLSNPFPNGLLQPTSTNAGLATLVGSSISPFFYLKRFPYNNRWNLSIQRQITGDTGIEVAYVGNTGLRIPVGSGGQEQNRQIHFLPAQYLSLGNQLNSAVANPFYGVITTPGPLSQPTIPLSSLLSTYPQFTSVNLLRQTEGRSYYHSLQTSFTKRYSAGFQIGGTYTLSKLIERMRYIDVTDPGPSKMIGEYDRPHRFTLNLLWELPFTKRGALGAVAGGWQVNAVMIYQSGGPIPLGNLLPTGVSPYLSRSEQSVDRWFNTAAFRIFPAFTVRTLPNYLNTLRNDGQNNWDLSLLKTFPITKERVRLQFRFEMFNALNRVQFGNPTINPSAVTDGQIFSQANAPRMLQFGLKLLF